MGDFVTLRGVWMLAELRATAPEIRLNLSFASQAPVKLVAQVPSEECGCPEELWIIDGIEAVIHFEKDGRSEIHLMAGDWNEEKTFECRNMPELRAALFSWVAELGEEP